MKTYVVDEDKNLIEDGMYAYTMTSDDSYVRISVPNCLITAYTARSMQINNISGVTICIMYMLNYMDSAGKIQAAIEIKENNTTLSLLHDGGMKVYAWCFPYLGDASIRI